MVLQNPYELIIKWYESSRIDYRDLYMRLYVAYNAWFRQVTGTQTDRDGIQELKKRFVIWYDYQQGVTLSDMKPIVDQLINELECNSSLKLNISDANDYKNLIECWYQVRCHLFHGSNVLLNDELIRLAYESLSLFMGEIVRRMRLSFTPDDLERLEEVSTIINYDPKVGEHLRPLQQSLQQKYVNSPDMWNVDMVPV